jgi:predicted Zn-dependent protease with MMP-like domain
MNNNEHSQSEEEEYDYNREPPLDSATASANRGRSKYVFMALCFLLSLLLFSTFVRNPFLTQGSDWFPLIGAIVLAVMGVVFLRSPDSLPTPQPTNEVEERDDKDNEQAAARSLSAFEELAQEALAGIPDEFHEKMDNVMVRVVYEPDEETLERVGVNEGYTLLGLYEGVPLTVYGRDHAPYPEMITIYQRTIEEHCQYDPERISEQVRSTVLHEVAHHFGMGHAEMPIWIK